MQKSTKLLFTGYDLSDLLRDTKESMICEINGIEGERFLNTAQADLVKYCVEKYNKDTPKLLRESITAAEEEVKVDVSRDPNRFIFDTSRPCFVPGQSITITIPVYGDTSLFFAKPSTFTLSPPRALINENSLQLIYEIPVGSNTEPDIKGMLNRTLDEIERHLGWIKADIDAFNNNIAPIVEKAITERRQMLLKHQHRLESLNIPIISRKNVPSTYVVPDVKRKIVPTLPLASNSPYMAEPTIDLKEYDHIIEIVYNMARVMECSPAAFASMREEDLRQHFLLHLNGHYEGRATGETFNYCGKTDIIIKEGSNNLFVAECKFWKGPEKYLETIDQILNYTTWRDTKTAIFVFNKNKDTTSVISKIDQVTPSHPNFKRKIEWHHESGFRYIFHHNSDKNKELYLTVLIFDVPTLKI